MRVTADTNIYISAFQYAGKPLEVLELAREGAIQLSVSEPILAELKGVLKRKFNRSDGDLQPIDEQIRSFAEVVTPTQAVDIVKEDPPDNRIIECAIEGKFGYIVTGDKDLLRLKAVGEIQIMQPGAFLDNEYGPSKAAKPSHKR